ncbi:toxin regulator [Halobacillus sp. K22]|uniref:toxin regulator n=1 Tax=Halobacillus sp. K22 TaxID=3457431 RepID=UPI003FCDD1CC
MKKSKKKVWLWISGGAIVFFIMIGMAVGNTAESESLNKKIASMEERVEKKDQTIAELEAKLAEAEPWFNLSEKEKERKLAEEKKKQEAEEAAAEKKAAEEKAKQEAEEEKAKEKAEEEAEKGYETGTTFEQLARTPEDYEGKKVKFSGEVIQVIEAEGEETQLRIAVDDDYDQVIFVSYDSSMIDSRILEDDKITIMGVSLGLLTYESTMGGEITVPAIAVDQIEQ